MTSQDLTKVRDELVSVARAAGDMMLNADLSTCTKSDTKNNSSDRVTETDKAIENMVESRLASRFPGVLFLGEETSGGKQKLTCKPTFVCDPIDGTLNFIHGVPNTAVSLGLTVNKKPVIGVVFNPYRDDMFSAIKGQGAFLTNVTGRTHRLPLRQIPAPMPSLTECLVAIEWGNQREGPNWDLRTSMHKTLMSTKATGGAMCRSTRSFGSAALDFCYVASGNIDVFWEGGCWIWDVCAGWIILEEAGGIVASANPGDWEPTLEGRLYMGVRGAKKVEQASVVRELWELMGKRKFVF